LFANDGGLTFSDIGAGSNVDYSNAACVASFTHYDDDGLIDLLTGDCNLAEPAAGPPGFTAIPGPLRLYTNNGDRTFTRQTELSLPDPTVDDQEQGFWMALSAGDLNNDLQTDIFATNFGTPVGQPHEMFLQDINGNFTGVGERFDLASMAPDFGWGSTIQDFNLDGRADLFLAGNFPIAGPIVSNPGYIFTNRSVDESSVEFDIDMLPGAPLVGRYSSGVASGDFNNDGRVDLVVSNSGFFNFATIPPENTVDQPTLLINSSETNNNWLTIKLQGTESNRSGIGAIIDVQSGDLSQRRIVSGGGGFLSRDSVWQTFGVSPADEMLSVRVTWPSGVVDQLNEVETNQTITIIEGSQPTE